MWNPWKKFEKISLAITVVKQIIRSTKIYEQNMLKSDTHLPKKFVLFA